MRFSLHPSPLPLCQACTVASVAEKESPRLADSSIRSPWLFTSPAMGISLTISSINCHFPPIYLFCDIFPCLSRSLPLSLSLALSLLVWLLFIVIVIVVACLYISWLCSSNCNNGVKCFTADKKFNLCENMFWPEPPLGTPSSPAQTARRADKQIAMRPDYMANICQLCAGWLGWLATPTVSHAAHSNDGSCYWPSWEVCSNFLFTLALNFPINCLDSLPLCGLSMRWHCWLPVCVCVCVLYCDLFIYLMPCFV